MQSLTARAEVDAQTLVERATWRWRLSYAAGVLGALFLVRVTFFSAHAGFPAALGLYAFGFVAILLRPVLGVYIITFFGLLADDVNTPWWPFLKNGSSAESVLYINDAVVVSPMETYLLATIVSVLLHITLRRLTFVRPPLIWPLSAFMFFIVVGFVWGVGRGGDLTIALWEARPFATLFIVYILATTLIRTRKQVYIVSWVVVGALCVEAARSMYWYLTTPGADLFNSPIEHSAASHMNLLFVTIILAWLVRDSGVERRLLIPLLCIPVVFIYLVSERRSAIAALMLCMAFVFIYVAAIDVRRFWQFGPMAVFFLIAYVLVFWNASGILGFPAGVVKAQISPESASLEDQSSDAYRVIEHLDILATIQRSPVMGIGFGQKYDKPIPLPDISFGFIWWEYITHNGIMWIWLKAGYFGFIAMFNFIGRALFLGMKTAVSVVDPKDRVIAASAAIFIPIYTIYSYVDISWGTQSLILLAVCLAMIGRLHEELEPTT